VRVVELNGHAVGKGVKGVVTFLVAAQDVLERGGDEEILLLESQFAVFQGLLAGVEHLGDVLVFDFFFDGANVIACIEEFELEFGV
jgi:hypothetical protein